MDSTDSVQEHGEHGEHGEQSRRGRRSAGRRGRWSRSRSVLTAMVALVGVVGLLAAGCSSDDSSDGGQNITIGYLGGWAEDVALTNLFSQQLENAGYNVKMEQLEAGPVFAGMAQGDVDMFLDTWLPTTHKQYWDKYGDKLEKLGGPWYDDASLDLTVPAYVEDVNSIADLKDHADEFGGEITGIDGGAGIMDQVKNHAMPEYGLDGVMTLKASSGTAMLAALDSAINDHKPIVVTLWHPHWAYSRYDLKDLQDPKGAMGEAEKLYITSRSGFSDDFPNVAKVASDFTIDADQLQALEDAIQKAPKGGTADAVTQWSEDNPDFIQDKFGDLETAGSVG